MTEEVKNYVSTELVSLVAIKSAKNVLAKICKDENLVEMTKIQIKILDLTISEYNKILKQK